MAVGRNGQHTGSAEPWRRVLPGAGILRNRRLTTMSARCRRWVERVRLWFMATWQEPSQSRGYLLAIGAVGVLSALIAGLERLWSGGIILAMLYLIAVLMVASLAGRGPAVLAAGLAFLAANFLFIEPRFTFTVDDPAEWLALLLFLLTALVTGHLAAGLREHARAAEQRARETATLYDLSQALTAVVGLPATLPVVTARIMTVFGTRSCAVLLPTAGGDIQLVAASGDVTAGDMADRDVRAIMGQVLATGKPLGVGMYASPRRLLSAATAPARRAVYLPLCTGGRTLGILRVGAKRDGRPLTATEERTLAAVAAQAALAISRAQFAAEATQAEVARRSDELKSALLSSVSHDLRTPLASIKTAVTSLLQPGIVWEEADQRDLLLAIDEEADRLTRLVANLLDVSRIEAGTLHPAADWVDVEETITRVVRRLRPHLEGHPLRVLVPVDLPLARFDAVHLEQVLTNVLENAATYTPPASPIEVAARLADRAIEVAVIDHGPGIPLASRQRVFDAFYRLPREGQRPGGTGLGLAIVRGLAEANGGQVWAEATPGGGATFRLTLPLGAPEAPHAAPDCHPGRRPA